MFKELFKEKKWKLEIPEIVIEDKDLEIEIGNWLGLLSSQRGYQILNNKIEIIIPFDTSYKIKEQFGIILNLMGIQNNEICRLKKLDDRNTSFECYFQKTNLNTIITLKKGIEKYGKRMIIECQNIKKVYHYFSQKDFSPMSLVLEKSSIQNIENGNYYEHHFIKNQHYFIVQNNEYQLVIQFSKKEEESIKYFNNEKKLEQYLLNLSFPIHIKYIYKAIYHLLSEAIEQSQNLELKIESKKDNQVDSITLTQNEVILIINNKKISLESYDKWTYESPSISVFHTSPNELAMNFYVKANGIEAMNYTIDPKQEYEIILDDVKEARQYIKSLIKR